MSQVEARVLIARLMQIAEDLRDLADDAPQHVAADRGRHIETILESVAELRRSYGVTG